MHLWLVSVFQVGAAPAILNRDHQMVLRMKPIRTDPKLLRALADSKAAWERMTDDEKEAMLRKQRESWTRQDMD